jgi:hypothetical protein
VSTLVPPLFTGLVDDAAVFPPGAADLPDAVVDHRHHRHAWYAPLVGPLLVPASAVGKLGGLAQPAEHLAIGLVGDTGLDGLAAAVDQAAREPALRVGQLELAVAKRGEDPQPGLRQLLTLAAASPAGTVYAEIPLTWGLLAALDTVAAARADGVDAAVKFRTGGLAAELFPTPVELAAVICACRDRRLPFKLTAGLHHALRHTDPETGFTHHGFLNVLVGAIVATDGAEVADVAELLATTHPMPLLEALRTETNKPRALWTGFGSCSVMEPLTDLVRLGLVDGGFE